MKGYDAIILHRFMYMYVYPIHSHDENTVHYNVYTLTRFYNHIIIFYFQGTLLILKYTLVHHMRQLSLILRKVIGWRSLIAALTNCEFYYYAI